jgi:hypothetical protein
LQEALYIFIGNFAPQLQKTPKKISLYPPIAGIGCPAKRLPVIALKIQLCCSRTKPRILQPL